MVERVVGGCVEGVEEEGENEERRGPEMSRNGRIGDGKWRKANEGVEGSGEKTTPGWVSEPADINFTSKLLNQAVLPTSPRITT